MSLFEQTASKIKQDKRAILRLNAEELRAIFDADQQKLVNAFGSKEMAESIRLMCHSQEIVLTSDDKKRVAMMKTMLSLYLQ
jgi:hypothetical protein